MPTKQDMLFDPTGAGKGTLDWDVEIFKRAYLRGGKQNGTPSPFKRVIERLRSGFSVLVYLPGNCMRAAAKVVRGVLSVRPEGEEWEEYGLPQENCRTIPEIWAAYTGLLNPHANRPPRAIFHNLDVLASQGALDMSNEAKTALFCIAECTRSGVALGLSDVAAGELPEVIRRPFGEEVRLDAIDEERFPFLIPKALARNLVKGDNDLPDGPAHLLASRLRWTDPIRAVQIMLDIAAANGIKNALTQVRQHAQSVEFTVPKTETADDMPPGYQKKTIEALKRSIIEPFKGWDAYDGNEPNQRLNRLPPGLILHGPPGTGKSRLAKWIAESIGIPYRQVGAADLKRPDWGLTERLVRDLFRSARRAAPCIIVLDDADDLLPDREGLEGTLASSERGVVNAFLQELEGFNGRLEGVLVVLTTNRLEALDRAARSRLPLRFLVPYPVTEDQIGEIIIRLSHDYGMEGEWPKLILERAKTLFFGALEPTNERIEDEKVREGMSSGLFSPREISSALGMMLDDGGNAPTEKDVERVKDYYNKLKQQCHAKPKT